MKLKHNVTLFGGRKTLKYIVLQQLFTKAKGTNKHAKWTGRQQLRKNCGKLRKIADLNPPPPEVSEGTYRNNGLVP